MNFSFKNDALGKLTLRLTLGILILFHGVHKIMHPSALDFIGKQLASINLPQEFAYGVYLGEVIAPLMIILGFYTRLGGLLIFGNMIFAIVLAHRNQLFDLTDNGGLALELQIIFLLSGLAVFFLGSGKIAIKAD